MILFIIILFLISPTFVFAQYVAQTLQQRIDNDNNSITLDQADITAKQADIDSIANDQSAADVVAQVPSLASIKSSNEVIAQPDNAQAIQ